MADHILLAAEIVSALAVLSGLLVGLWKIIQWGKYLVEGERCHLRSDMLRTYYRNKDKKTIHQYERENFDKSYKAYKCLKGNSFIDDIYQEVKRWEIIA